MLAYDFRNGLWHRKIWLILPIAFFGMALCGIAPYIRYSEYHMTLGGALLKLMQGTAPVDMEMREFHVPVVWLMIHLGCVFFTVEYPTRDMNFFGQQIMIRSRNKGRWLLSKYCWNAASVLIYWLIGYLMVIVFCAFYKTPMSLGVDGNLAGGMDGCDIFRDYFTANVMALRLIFMPFLTSLTISFIQMFVAIMLNDIFAVATSMFILVWSMCILNPLAIGNYSMLQRSNVFRRSGVSPMVGIPLMLTLIVITITANYILFKRKDILEPKKDGE